MGPTPGHVYPALAVAEAVRAAQPDARIIVAGPARGAYNGLIDPTLFEVATIQDSPLVGTTFFDWVCAPHRVAAGVSAIRRLLQRERADMVIGFGASVSGAAVLAARTLGVLTAVHEANVLPGLSNALVGRIVDRVYVAVDSPSGWWRRASRTQTVGTPVRAGISALVHLDRVFPDGRTPHVLVAGGGMGARFVAREVPRLLGEVRRCGVAFEVWHQAGSESIESVQRAYSEADVPARVTPYIDDMTAAYRWADFVIARSGAGIISELAIAGLPGLLVPWADAAYDHQAANARAFTRVGAGIWTRETDWAADRIADHVARLLSNDEWWRRASTAARTLARPDAAALIASDALALIASRQ